MKIAPKLALIFTLMAVIPLGLASAVFMISTNFVATNISDQAQDALSTRLSDGLSRATRLSAEGLQETRDRLIADLQTGSNEIALSLTADAPETSATTDEILRQATENATNDQLDLTAASVRIEPDANRDSVAELLTKLEGLEDVGRVTFLRNQAILSGMSLALEDGLTVWFPSGSTMEVTDPREAEWYLSTLETIQPRWHASAPDGGTDWIAAIPIQQNDGMLLGVFRFLVSLQSLLDTVIPAAALPTDATAHLIVIPQDHPNLFPHRIAQRGHGDAAWQVLPRWEPLTPIGDEAWLKILSDMRSGVEGMVSVVRDEKPEVWSFLPAGEIAEGPVYLALTLPQSALDSARSTAEKAVARVFRTQLRDALMFAMAAGFAALGLGFIVARTLTTPIEDLHTAATKLGQGDFNVRVTPKGSDEIAELAKGFNQMVPALADQVRLAKDLKIAHEIQQHLIPSSTPRLPGFDIAGRAEYCDETGGDYLDFVPINDGTKLGCAIGDVTGHGVGAALMMTSARAALRAHAHQGLDVHSLINALNTDVVADATGGRFLTLFYVQVSADTRHLEWISCGHESPLLYDMSDDSFQLLEGEGIPLGVDGTWAYTAKSVELEAQSMLIGYTDGVREAKNADGDQYGLDRLKAVIIAAKQRGADGIAGAILDDVAKHRGDTTRRDDETVLVIKPM